MRYKARRLLYFTIAFALALAAPMPAGPLAQPAYAAGAALAVVVEDRPCKPGDTFTARLVLSDNPGFAGMALKISYPAGIEATSVQPVGVDMADMMDLAQSLTLPYGWTYGNPLPAPIPNSFIAVWGRTSNYSTPNAALLEIVFRVTADADIGAKQISVAFESAQGPRSPINLDEQPLAIASVPGTVTIQRDLAGIIAPSAVAGVPHGAAKTAAALGLPDVVEISLGIAADGTTMIITTAGVAWDVAGSSYDPAMAFAQAFRVNGTLSLPENVLNPGGAIPLGISVDVMVEAGDAGAELDTPPDDTSDNPPTETDDEAAQGDAPKDPGTSNSGDPNPDDPNLDDSNPDNPNTGAPTPGTPTPGAPTPGAPSSGTSNSGQQPAGPSAGQASTPNPSVTPAPTASPVPSPSAAQGNQGSQGNQESQSSQDSQANQARQPNADGDQEMPGGAAAPWANPFTDVHEGDWFYGDVAYAVQNGLFVGLGETTFGPDDPITRGMLVTVLWRIEGQPGAPGTPMGFADVSADGYYRDAVAWASANGVVFGVEEDLFAPDDPVTRQQTAAILVRYASYAGKVFPANDEYIAFADADQIDGYAQAPIQTLFHAGIIQGVGGDRVDPRGHASRAQAAAILRRYADT